MVRFDAPTSSLYLSIKGNRNTATAMIVAPSQPKSKRGVPIRSAPRPMTMIPTKSRTSVSSSIPHGYPSFTLSFDPRTVA